MFAKCASILVLLVGFWKTDASINDVKIDSVDEALRLFNRSVVESNRLQNEVACAFLKEYFGGALKSHLIMSLDPFAMLSLTGKPWLVEEIEIFRAVRAWVLERNDTDQRIEQQLLQNVFLVAMNAEQLRNEVLESQLFTAQEIIEALAIKAWGMDSEKYLRFPNQLAFNDVVVEGLGAKIIKGNCRDKNRQILRSNGGVAIDHFCYHNFSDPRDSIIVRLGAGFTIDTIVVGLFDFDTRRYSLEVDVGSNGVQWSRVGRSFSVRGRQVFNFDEKSVKFIRITGTGRFPSGPTTLVVNEIKAFRSKS